MRLSTVVVVLLAACAVAGCTTVSPSAGPSPTPAHRASGAVPPTPPVAPQLADERRPEPDGTPTVPRTRAPVREQAPPVPRIPRSVTLPRSVGSVPCSLGRAYGFWAAGSQAASICSGVYGR